MVVAPALVADIDLVHDAEVGLAFGHPWRRPRRPPILSQIQGPSTDIHLHLPSRITDLERREVVDIVELTLVLEPQPVLLSLARRNARRQRHLLQRPGGVLPPAPHVEDLVGPIIRIGLRGAQKLHGVRSLDQPAILHPADVMVVLGKGIRNPDFLQRGRIVPARLPRNIHQTVPREHLAVEGPVVVVLRLRRVVVRAPQIHQIAAPIRLHADARIKRLPAASLGL